MLMASLSSTPAAAAAFETTPEAAAEAYQLGVTAHQRGDLAAAAVAFERAVALNPMEAAHFYAAATMLRASGRPAEAIQRFGGALALNPGDAGALIGLGHSLAGVGRADDAARAYRRASSAQPAQADARTNLVRYLQGQGRLAEAVEILRAATHGPFGALDDFFNLAIVLSQLGRRDDAVDCLRRAIRRHPDSAAAMVRLANLHLTEFEVRQAEAWAALAVDLAPDDADAWDAWGRAYERMGRHADAAPRFKRAIALRPGLAHPYFNLGMMLEQTGRMREVPEPYDRSVRLNPDLLIGYEKLAFKFAQCVWRDYDEDVARCLDVVRRRGDKVLPLAFLYIPSTPADQFLCAKRALDASVPPSARRSAFALARQPKDRLTVGYVSGDLRAHAVAFLIAEMFELHDRERFRVLGYCAGPDRGDQPMRRRLSAAFDEMTVIRDMDAMTAARRIHQDGVDILVDLSGHTRYSRHDVFALRPAPVQVNYLGYPGTVGADFIDYILTDVTVTPLEEQPWFAERLARLPHCYQANDRKRTPPGPIPSRADCGLPEDAFVFCCFNNTAKFSPHVFDSWMRMLKAVPGSVLWVLAPEPWVLENLRRETATRGVDPARLVFAPRADQAHHLARMALADLFVDTPYYNAHTTGSDALWVGLPLLTVMGDSFPGRVGASLLKAVGLPELIAGSLAEYEAMAVALARDPARLAALRARLIANRDASPLFDTPRFTRHVERAYEIMWTTWLAAEPPRPFTVSPDP